MAGATTRRYGTDAVGYPTTSKGSWPPRMVGMPPPRPSGSARAAFAAGMTDSEVWHRSSSCLPGEGGSREALGRDVRPQSSNQTVSAAPETAGVSTAIDEPNMSQRKPRAAAGRLWHIRNRRNA